MWDVVSADSGAAPRVVRGPTPSLPVNDTVIARTNAMSLGRLMRDRHLPTSRARRFRSQASLVSAAELGDGASRVRVAGLGLLCDVRSSWLEGWSRRGDGLGTGWRAPPRGWGCALRRCCGLG